MYDDENQLFVQELSDRLPARKSSKVCIAGPLFGESTGEQWIAQ